MRQLSEEGRRTLDDIARRHGVAPAAAEQLLTALIAGQGVQAQFNHPDLGGMGQWSEGGMIMIGDMFNNGLKATVDGLCRELAALLRNADLLAPPASHQSQLQSRSGPADAVSLFVPGGAGSGDWWPEGLGLPASTGAQNDLRYAFFPAARRLAIDLGGQVKVYDTKDHRIGGFSQQQGGGQSLTFTSQHGPVRLPELDEVAAAGAPTHGETPVAPAAAQGEPPLTAAPPPGAPPAAAQAQDAGDIFARIERLADLHEKGILTDAEFQAKKAELLARI